MKRTCKKCLEKKDLESEFYKSAVYKGTIYHDHECKVCRNQYNSKYWKENWKAQNNKHLLRRRKTIRERAAEDVLILHSNYVKKAIRKASGFELRWKDISEEMVEFKRRQLIIFRLIRKGKKHGTINNRD